MSKRHNPFDDNFCQYKTHVGEKEVNKGVDFEVKMKAVYERTLGLLMDGQRHRISSSLSSRDTAPSPIKPKDGHVLPCAQDGATPKWAQGQYTLDKLGHLSTQQPCVGIHHTSDVQKTQSSGCPHCKSQVPSCPVKCVFCERSVCLQCCRECVNCSGIFCSLCSLINYDESFERCFCLSCCAT